MILKWHRLPDVCVDQKLPAYVELHMSEVTQVTVGPRDPSQPYSEDDCLASFGYDSDEEWAHGQFWVDGKADNEWRWSFLF